MRLIIAGGRRHYLTPADYEWLDTIEGVTEVVSGGATGVDECGEKWANLRGLPVKRFPAEWDRLGKRAGYARNESMAIYADALAIFPGGKGTNNMRLVANRLGIPIYERTPSETTSDTP